MAEDRGCDEEAQCITLNEHTDPVCTGLCHTHLSLRGQG